MLKNPVTVALLSFSFLLWVEERDLEIPEVKVEASVKMPSKIRHSVGDRMDPCGADFSGNFLERS